MRTFLTLAVILILVTGAIFAVVPTTMNYQGYLTDNVGDPVTDGSYSVVFNIYDNAVAGSSVWDETQNVTTTDGLFSVLLGTVTPITNTVFNGTTRYLGIAVAGDPELSPRTALVSVPYAMRVSTVDGASGGSVAGNLSVTGKGTFGSGHTNSGANGFVAGINNTASGTHSVVSGGEGNDATNTWSTVSGGRQNLAGANMANVSGGELNDATGLWSAIGGGRVNLASGSNSVVAGGEQDTASGHWSTVPGGRYNAARGSYSFAAGRNAKATHLGSFVWADATGADMPSQADNHFVVRASGGYKFATDAAATTGVTLTPGASSWTGFSDSTMKRNIRVVDYEDVLAKVDELPIKQWSFKSQPEDLEHMGPMAQDFYRLFGLDEDDRHINTIDPPGVALAAIKGLNQKMQRELETKESEIVDLQKQIDELKALVQKLAEEKEGGSPTLGLK